MWILTAWSEADVLNNTTALQTLAICLTVVCSSSLYTQLTRSHPQWLPGSLCARQPVPVRNCLRLTVCSSQQLILCGWICKSVTATILGVQDELMCILFMISQGMEDDAGVGGRGHIDLTQSSQHMGIHSVIPREHTHHSPYNVSIQTAALVPVSAATGTHYCDAAPVNPTLCLISLFSLCVCISHFHLMPWIPRRGQGQNSLWPLVYF